ncbi:hypothetical protein [Bdellovibrio bacteriovorus]|uniref:hypothetical protein n=1 Tax=Bdellovibrio bacteriovorus TaxID=959 RepID=UPI003AA95BA0
MKMILPAIGVLTLSACTSQEYKWAFAQNIDNSFYSNEYCRESLANTIYASETKDKTKREAKTNVFVFHGNIESYRIYAFKTQNECETALTNMKARQ